MQKKKRIRFKTDEERLESNRQCKERYDDLKRLGICVSCGQRDAFYNHVRCPECIEKEVIHRALRRDKINAYKRERWKKCVENGECVVCKKPVCDESKSLCKEHLERQRASNRRCAAKRYAKNRTLSLDELEQKHIEACRKGGKASINLPHVKEFRERLRQREHIIVQNILKKKELKKNG